MSPSIRAAVLCLDVQSPQLFDLARSSVAALANLLCLLHQQAGEKLLLGLCSLTKSPSTGKVQLQVRCACPPRSAHCKHATAAVELSPSPPRCYRSSCALPSSPCAKSTLQRSSCSATLERRASPAPRPLWRCRAWRLCSSLTPPSQAATRPSCWSQTGSIPQKTSNSISR